MNLAGQKRRREAGLERIQHVVAVQSAPPHLGGRGYSLAHRQDLIAQHAGGQAISCATRF